MDLDLSEENLPAGRLLAVGEAVVRLSDVPHTGCKNFRARYAQVVRAGTIRVGDVVRKVEA